jgi:hypothetical protein
MQQESSAEVRMTRIVAGLLSLQLTRLERAGERVAPAAFDDFSMGYMVGFVGVMAERAGMVDSDDASRMFAVLAKALFGRETGERLSAKLADFEDLPDAFRGASIGRSDSRSWLRDPTIPPLAWYNYCRFDAPRIAKKSAARNNARVTSM